jgi:hypothetical protein
VGNAPPAGLEVGDQAFRVVRWLPTESDTRVAVCRAADGCEVVLKMALGDRHVLSSGVAEVQAQIRHLRALRAAVPDPALYPEILASDEKALVLPFYPLGSLEDRQTPGDLGRRLLAAALEQLFAVSSLGRTLSSDPPSTADFLLHEMRMRIDRLRHAIIATGAGRRFAAARPAWEAGLQEIERRLAPFRKPRILDALTSIPLGLAAHGDFVPGNVLVLGTEPARVVFIDLRGSVVWKHDLPWWDPAMDVAALIAQLLIGPVLAAWAPSRPSSVPPDEIPGLCRELSAARRWESGDPAWRERLDLYVVLKLLGKIAFQLVYPPARRVERAAAAWELMMDRLERLRPPS